MAKQKGIIKLDGTISDITFLKTWDGYLAKEKSSISAERIASDPAFQRTRENGAEFGRAGKAGKLLRHAFRAVIQNASDQRMVGRLTKEMVRVIQADATNGRGLRNVIDGEAELLEGFDFNANSHLRSTVYAEFTATINRVTGAAVIDLPSYVPSLLIAAPSGTTHYRFLAMAASIDFELQHFVADAGDSGDLPWHSTPVAASQLALNLPAASVHPLFLCFGILFLQEVNGQQYPLRNGAFNALALVKVNGA
ncbi:MAG: hypothetical protein JWP69_2199 [Flaviaesturariibacter sp.]|nr:hypothetical protein [Flaviaesturariibacter sp.]